LRRKRQGLRLKGPIGRYIKNYQAESGSFPTPCVICKRFGISWDYALTALGVGNPAKDESIDGIGECEECSRFDNSDKIVKVNGRFLCRECRGEENPTKIVSETIFHPLFKAHFCTINCGKMENPTKKKCSACGSGNVYRRGKRLADEELVCRACGYVGPAKKEGEKDG